MKRLRLAGAALFAALALSSCTPEQAIAVFFGRHGPEVQRQALEVARCESGLNPTARNGEYLGLFQMGHYHYWRFGGGDWSDPVVNARAAADLYTEQGWGPWSCRP